MWKFRFEVSQRIGRPVVDTMMGLVSLDSVCRGCEMQYVLYDGSACCADGTTIEQLKRSKKQLIIILSDAISFRNPNHSYD